MGRSKRARGPARPGAEPARAVQAIPARRPRWSRSGLPVVLLGLAVLGLWRWRGSGTAPDVPDPLTAEMPSPVARAHRSAREAVLAEPGSARAWGEFASVCDAHHLYDAAAAAYGRARALAPGEFRWVYLLAIVRDFQGAGAEEVAALFAEAARLEPGYPPLHLRRGDAFVRQGALEDARAAYARALELDPAFALDARSTSPRLLRLLDAARAERGSEP
jgi:cytochrome c-type biogenesis protein CcmH/NrfG